MAYGLSKKSKTVRLKNIISSVQVRFVYFIYSFIFRPENDENPFSSRTCPPFLTKSMRRGQKIIITLNTSAIVNTKNLYLPAD